MSITVFNIGKYLIIDYGLFTNFNTVCQHDIDCIFNVQLCSSLRSAISFAFPPLCDGIDFPPLIFE